MSKSSSRLSFIIIPIFILIFFLPLPASARALKMVFWYPGEAGSTAEGQPIIDEFTKLLSAKLAPDTMTGKYFNTVEGGRTFIKNEQPVIGILSYEAWAQNKDKLAGASVIMAVLPAPHGKRSEQYSLVGLSQKMPGGANILSSEPLSLQYVREELFSDIPHDAKLAQSNQLLMKLKDIGDGRLAAFAILTPAEAQTLGKLSAAWAKNLKTVAQSKPVPTARVILFDPSYKDTDRLKKALTSIGSDSAAKDVLGEMRLVGFAPVNN